jgi:hypothetical protein
MRDFIEKIILGNIAAGLDSGRYGAFAQRAFRFGKGYATWTGAALALLFAAAAQFDNSGASTVIARVSAGLAGVGLVRKGAHMQPPDIPLAMRDALEAGASMLAWLLMAANGVIYICQQIHASWACGISSDAQAASLVLTAVSGFVATYVAEPPASSRS